MATISTWQPCVSISYYPNPSSESKSIFYSSFNTFSNLNPNPNPNCKLNSNPNPNSGCITSPESPLKKNHLNFEEKVYNFSNVRNLNPKKCFTTALNFQLLKSTFVHHSFRKSNIQTSCSQHTENGHVSSFKVRDQLKDARKAALLRAQESLRTDALFQDPYAAALAGERDEGEGEGEREGEEDDQGFHGKGFEYVVATSVIDKAAMETVANDSVRQVVLLTDGMDTRPYRLPWPSQTRLFDVSPAPVYNYTCDVLKLIGAKVSRGAVLCHVSADVALGDDWRDEGWGEKLQRMGYRGDLPSLWIMQGLEGLTEEGLRGVLGHVSCLAMAGTLFAGELSFYALGKNVSQNLLETDEPEEIVKSMEVMFANAGLSAQSYPYARMAQNLGRPTNEQATRGTTSNEYGKLLFSATQRRLSDAQAEIARFEMLRADDEGDEMGFEDSF